LDFLVNFFYWWASNVCRDNFFCCTVPLLFLSVLILFILFLLRDFKNLLKLQKFLSLVQLGSNKIAPTQFLMLTSCTTTRTTQAIRNVHKYLSTWVCHLEANIPVDLDGLYSPIPTIEISAATHVPLRLFCNLRQASTWCEVSWIWCSVF
jgi:hypothetical protein